MTPSYWWPLKPRHYFKQREHQHYFTISIADLFDFVSVPNVATIVINYMNILWLPHIGDPKTKAFTSNTGYINTISQFLLQICLILFQFTVRLPLHILHELLVASSYWWPPKSRLYVKHSEHQHYFTISLADLFDFVSVHNTATIAYTTWTFGCFLILVTSKIKNLLQAQWSSTFFYNFSCGFVWFCFIL